MREPELLKCAYRIYRTYRPYKCFPLYPCFSCASSHRLAKQQWIGMHQLAAENWAINKTAQTYKGENCQRLQQCRLHAPSGRELPKYGGDTGNGPNRIRHNGTASPRVTLSLNGPELQRRASKAFDGAAHLWRDGARHLQTSGYCRGVKSAGRGCVAICHQNRTAVVTGQKIAYSPLPRYLPALMSSSRSSSVANVTALVGY